MQETAKNLILTATCLTARQRQAFLFEKKRICGREFGSYEIGIIEEEIRKANPVFREEIARQVCERLSWYDRLGRKKIMSCKVALLRLDRLGLIKLPPPRNRNGNGKRFNFTDIPICEVPKSRVVYPVGELRGLRLESVKDSKASRLWNALIGKYHYLGYTPLPGAQQRYIIKWDSGILGAVGFSASAWKLKPRDSWIGWDSLTREKLLHLIVNNSRFLILPWVRSKNLASKVLSICTQRVQEDFSNCYGYRPVLLETFVETGRFAGTSYKAANWIYLGKTKGRGKLDRYNKHSLPVKDIYVYPLERNFRTVLGVS